MSIKHWGPVDELVVAVGGRDDEVAQAISSAGPADVAALLAAEIQARGSAPPDVGDVSVQLGIDHEGEVFDYVVSFADGGFAVEAGRAHDVHAEVRYALPDLARSLYPHRPGYESTSRDVRVHRWPWMQPGGDLSPDEIDAMVRRGEADAAQLSAQAHERFATLFRATQAVIAACSTEIASLDELAAMHGSDKWGGLHWYTPHYARHFAAMRFDPVRVLEIGIGGYRHLSLGGDSLYVWQRYFPRGLVYGLDVHPKPQVTGPRIRAVQGDQGDAAFLEALGERHGPFDVVVDDGSHLNEHVRTSFEALFAHVRPGGYYVIEDLHTSYWPAFGGEPPPGSSRTTIGMIKDLLDDLHVSEIADNERTAAATHPSDVCVYHNLAFLRKGINHERGVPAWIKQRASASTSGAPSPGDV